MRLRDSPNGHLSTGGVRFGECDTRPHYRNKDVGGRNGTRLGLRAKSRKEPAIWKIDARNSNKEAQGRPKRIFAGLSDTLHISPGFRIILTTSVDNACGLPNVATGAIISLIYRWGGAPNRRIYIVVSMVNIQVFKFPTVHLLTW